MTKSFFFAVAAVANTLKQKQKLNLVFDGDSLTRGFNNSGQEQYYPNLVKDAFYEDYDVTFNSFGVSGQRTEQMIADADTQIYPLAVEGRINILIAWEDANAIIQLDNGYDNSNTVSAEQNFDDFVTYFEGATGFQYKILITGYYPRKNGSGDYAIGAYKALLPSLDEQEAFFDLVAVADINTVPWTHHIDLRNAPNIGGAKGQNENPTYFNDYLHLEAAGYDIVADEVISVMSGILS